MADEICYTCTYVRHRVDGKLHCTYLNAGTNFGFHCNNYRHISERPTYIMPEDTKRKVDFGFRQLGSLMFGSMGTEDMLNLYDKVGENNVDIKR